MEFKKPFALMDADENNMVELTNENLNEDYGWEISSDDAWDYLEKIEREIGTEELLMNLAKAMGDDALADNLSYIARQFDLDYLFDAEDDIEVDDEFDDEFTGMN